MALFRAIVECVLLKKKYIVAMTAEIFHIIYAYSRIKEICLLKSAFAGSKINFDTYLSIPKMHHPSPPPTLLPAKKQEVEFVLRLIYRMP